MCKSLWLSFASVLFAMSQAHAVNVPDLYEVATPVTSSRDAAFVEALKTVLVRVSGRRDAPDRLGEALGNPRQYVQRFGFTSDNILQAAFDSRSIDRLLSEAGLPIWGRERPATLVMLGLEGADGSLNWMDASTGGSEREAIVNSARLRGVPLVWPQMDSQDRIQASAFAGNASPAGLLDTAARYGANAVLYGVGRRDGTGNVYVRWTLVMKDNGQELQGSLGTGIDLAADTFAGVYAASGSSLDSVALEVSGIGNLSDYASTLNYLENMTVVRSVAVEQVAGDTLHFRLAVRGDATHLKRALALDNKLVPLNNDAGFAGERLQFRYQP